MSDENRYFKVKRIEVRDPETSEVVNVIGEMVVKDQNLVYTIQGSFYLYA